MEKVFPGLDVCVGFRRKQCGRAEGRNGESCHKWGHSGQRGEARIHQNAMRSGAFEAQEHGAVKETL